MEELSTLMPLWPLNYLGTGCLEKFLRTPHNKLGALEGWCDYNVGVVLATCFERARCTKIRHVMSFWTSVGVSMEMPPFTFQSAYDQVVAWCKYSSSETDGRIAS